MHSSSQHKIKTSGHLHHPEKNIWCAVNRFYDLTAANKCPFLTDMAGYQLYYKYRGCYNISLKIRKLESIETFVKISIYTNYLIPTLSSLSTLHKVKILLAADKGLIKTEQTAEISRADGHTSIYIILQNNMVTLLT
jgi:hypothetical protein